MKYNNLRIILCVCLIVLLCFNGCNQHNSPHSNNLSTENKIQNIYFGHGFNEDNPNSVSVNVKTREITLDYFIHNIGDCSIYVHLFVLIDGIIQPIEQAAENNINIGERKSLKISFLPTIIELKTDYSLTVIALARSSMDSSSDLIIPVRLGTQKIVYDSVSMSCKIAENCSVDKTFSLQKMDSGYEVNAYLPLCKIVSGIDSNGISVLSQTDEELNLSLEFIGEQESLYRASVCINSTPTLINDKYLALDLPYVENMLTAKTISVPKRNLSNNDLVTIIFSPIGTNAIENELIPCILNIKVNC